MDVSRNPLFHVHHLYLINGMKLNNSIKVHLSQTLNQQMRK